MDRHEITLWIEYVNTLLLVYIFRNLIVHGFFSLYIATIFKDRSSYKI